jgi:hypothetical protein
MGDGTSAGPTGAVLVVTGPPGAGKSTVAPLVAAGLEPPTACIEADWFWTTISSGFIPPWEPESDHQNRTILRSTMAVAAEMGAGGYRVVIDGVIGPWHLPVATSALAPSGVDLDYVVLRPDLATCLARAARRAGEPARVPGHPPLTASGPIRHMWDQFADLGPYETHVVDTTDLDATETVDRITRLRAAGRLRV